MMLSTNRLNLREVSLNDVDNIHLLHSLPETDRYNTLGIPLNLEQTKLLVSEWIEMRAELLPKRYVFCIENMQQEFIGLVGITMGKARYRNAEIWYKIHPAHWSRGYATEVVLKMLDFGFGELKLHRIEAGCATANVASIRVLEKAGMLREGLKRKILPIRGEWVDNYIYAILEEDHLRES